MLRSTSLKNLYSPYFAVKDKNISN